MAVEKLQDLLVQEGALDLTDKYLQVKTEQDGYTRTHRGIYNYKVLAEGEEFGIFPVELDGKGTIKVMKKSPIAYTEGDTIHFVVNTVVDPYNVSYIRSESIKGLDKGKQLGQAFLAFVADRFRLGVYNVFLVDEANYIVKSPEDTDGKEVKEVDEFAHEDLIVRFPGGNEYVHVKGWDSGDGQGDTSPSVEAPSEPQDVKVEAKETTATVSAK